MKSFILVCLFALAQSASANTFYCIGKYFNGMEGKHTLTGDITSATSVGNVVLTVDQEVYFKAVKLKKDPKYKPRDYKGYISLVGKMEDQTQSGQYASFGVLFEENFKSMKKFKAVVTERASDGGSYNKFYCYNNAR